jgi:hypothetical protein
MAMLSKGPDPKMGTFDGFDPKAVYQMIPVNGVRTGFKIVSAAEPLEIEIQPAAIARFNNKRFSPGVPSPGTNEFVSIGAATTFTFDLEGQAAGSAILVIRNSKGKSLESLLISVKAELPKTYSLCVLHDMRRRSPWLPPNDPTQPNPPPADSVIRPMMEKVKLTFRQQTNVILNEKGARLFEVNVNDRSLGDPIVLDAPLAPTNSTAASFIVSRTDSQAFGANFIVYFTWNIRTVKDDVVGLNVNNVCFVEFNSVDRNENGLTTGHELGHALGLKHNGRDLLMAGDGISRSSRLEQFEIDTVNPSGTVT